MRIGRKFFKITYCLIIFFIKLSKIHSWTKMSICFIYIRSQSSQSFEKVLTLGNGT